MGRGVARWIATFFFIGLLPKAPGTWATLVTLLLWLLLPAIPFWIFLLNLVVIIVVGSAAATVFEREHGHDDGRIVIDEVAGAMIAVAGFPPGLGIAVAGFVLFRFFDIAKPPPIYQLQSLRGGVGVMADDVAAGLLANVVIRVGLFVGPWIGGFFG